MIEGTKPFRGKKTGAAAIIAGGEDKLGAVTSSPSTTDSAEKSVLPGAAERVEGNGRSPALDSAPSDAANRAGALRESSTTKPGATPALVGRRAWFSALVPALGGGLVKTLRETNLLQEELRTQSRDPRR